MLRRYPFPPARSLWAPAAFSASAVATADFFTRPGTHVADSGNGLNSGSVASSSSSFSSPSSVRCCCCFSSSQHTSLRALHTVTTAANFDVEVIQSQQAICVVYYIPNNSSCSAYLKTAEKLVDELNAATAATVAVDDDVQAEDEVGGEDGTGVVVEEAAGRVAGNQPEGTTVEVDLTGHGGGSGSADQDKGKGKGGSKARKKGNVWLKLCTINADENVNLASAFSVERAKLPMTYFVMQSTIIDKVVGHISEARLRGILHNFLEHYQKQMNVDLMAKSASRYGESGGAASPLPSAEKADLLQAGASSQYIKDKIMSSLVGSEMIALPEEAAHLDGLRTLVQDGKKKAHAELQELYRQLGMDVRRLSDSEMHKHYFQSTQFTTVAVISALEALFLAREFAFLGDISRDNVEWARRAVQKDFEPILGHHEMRKVLALVDVNLLRGELQLSQRSATVEMQSIVSSLQAMQEGGGVSGQSSSSSATLQQRFQDLQQQNDFNQMLLSVIDSNIDTRVLESAFPSAVVDDLFEKLKAALKESRAAQAQQRKGEAGSAGGGHSSSSSSNGKGGRRVGLAAEERAQQLKTVIMSLLQLYPTDSKSQMARSRLSSLIF